MIMCSVIRSSTQHLPPIRHRCHICRTKRYFFHSTFLHCRPYHCRSPASSACAASSGFSRLFDLSSFRLLCPPSSPFCSLLAFLTDSCSLEKSYLEPCQILSISHQFSSLSSLLLCSSLGLSTLSALLSDAAVSHSVNTDL